MPVEPRSKRLVSAFGSVALGLALAFALAACELKPGSRAPSPSAAAAPDSDSPPVYRVGDSLTFEENGDERPIFVTAVDGDEVSWTDNSNAKWISFRDPTVPPRSETPAGGGPALTRTFDPANAHRLPSRGRQASLLQGRDAGGRRSAARRAPSLRGEPAQQDYGRGGDLHGVADCLPARRGQRDALLRARNRRHRAERARHGRQGRALYAHRLPEDGRASATGCGSAKAGARGWGGSCRSRAGGGGVRGHGAGSARCHAHDCRGREAVGATASRGRACGQRGEPSGTGGRGVSSRADDGGVRGGGAGSAPCHAHGCRGREDVGAAASRGGACGQRGGPGGTGGRRVARYSRGSQAGKARTCGKKARSGTRRDREGRGNRGCGEAAGGSRVRNWRLCPARQP